MCLIYHVSYSPIYDDLSSYVMRVISVTIRSQLLLTSSPYLIHLPHLNCSIWPEYSRTADNTSGVFTMLATRKEKIERFNTTHIITSAFASMPVVSIYNLKNNKAVNAGPAVQVTAEIIGGILGGSITHWDDSLIKAANPSIKDVLPNLLITVVAAPSNYDATHLMMRFLLESSPTFLKRYKNIAGNITDLSSFQFSLLIPQSRLIMSETNPDTDSLVSSIYGSFGYYIHTDVPVSSIARYCKDSVCAAGSINPSSVDSIRACSTPETIIADHVGNINTYDLMSSTAPACYPIVGTVDYSFRASSAETCDGTGQSTESVLYNRIKISSWLYSSPAIANHVVLYGIAATTDSERVATYHSICDVKCNGKAYGYQLCGYRKCSWIDGDYEQVQSTCDPSTEMETISYQLISGRDCISSPADPPYESQISCPEVFLNYRTGQIITSLSIIGLVVAIIVSLLVLKYRNEKIIRKSQPTFIFIFLFGAFCMNLCINIYVGPHTDVKCLLRPWAFNLSSTTMYAPLLMKLHRIDLLYRHSKKLKKTAISDSQVIIILFLSVALLGLSIDPIHLYVTFLFCVVSCLLSCLRWHSRSWGL